LQVAPVFCCDRWCRKEGGAGAAKYVWLDSGRRVTLIGLWHGVRRPGYMPQILMGIVGNTLR